MINQSEHNNEPKKRVKESVRVLSKLSFGEEGRKHGSLATVAGITNTMVGSVCLVVPQVFLQSGIFTCIGVMIVLGLVQCKTCYLFILHQKDSEVDTEHMIKRLLGKKWTQIFRVTSGTLLFIVGIIYFQLINLTLYPILKLIFIKCDYQNYESDTAQITFDKFSIQWQAIILFLPLSCMQLFKDITKLIKLAHYGIVAIIAYCCFIVYIFLNNIFSDNFSSLTPEIKYFTWNITQPGGQFALAFMVHNTIGQLVKNNKNKDNNSRDLAVSYLLAGTIYGTIGIFGAIGLLGKSAIDPSTILDFFAPDDIAVLIIESLFLIHLVSAFPIYPYISKLQILETFYPKDQFNKFVYWGFSAAFMICCLIIQLLSINVGVVIAFDGAVCGFLLVYIIPIFMHYKCYYGKNKIQNVVNDAEQNYLLDAHECNSHPQKDKFSIALRSSFYILLCGVGLYNLFIQFYDLFK